MSPNSNSSSTASPRTVPPHLPLANSARPHSNGGPATSTSSSSSSTSSPARPASLRQPAPRPPSDDAPPGRPLSQRKRDAEDRSQDPSEPAKERKADARPRRVEAQARTDESDREAPPPPRLALTAAQLHEALQVPPGPRG